MSSALALASLVAPQGAGAAPVVAGFNVVPYASVIDPMNMAFATDGTLYVGRDNFGSGGDFGDAVRIHRVAIGGGVTSEYGDIPIPDPDAMAFDVLGTISGVSGSVLVGSGAGLFAIHPDGVVATVFTAAEVGGDNNGMEFDSTGRLLMLSGLDQIKVTSGSAPTLLGPVVTSTPVSIAIDNADRIYLGGLSGTVSVYDSLGSLVRANLLNGLGWNTRVAVGKGGAFGTGLYAMTNDGDLFSVAADGTKVLFGSGFSAGTVMTAGSWIAFGPDGALYVAEFPNDRILRVSAPLVVPEPATFALLSLGLVGIAASRRRRLS